MDEDWWCPTELFLDPDALGYGGYVVLVDVDDNTARTHANSSRTIPKAFDQMYAENAIWVERVPYKLRHAMENLGPDKKDQHPKDGTYRLHYQVSAVLKMLQSLHQKLDVTNGNCSWCANEIHDFFFVGWCENEGWERQA
jgi:hypothetical protein